MNNKKLKNKLYHIIFEAETQSGKLFDILLLIIISSSVLCIILESVQIIKLEYLFLLQKKILLEEIIFIQEKLNDLL